jgi:8-oxo-dGTP diphosphatase
MVMIELAGCVIRDPSGKVLLLHRNTRTLQQWELPGGKVEQGESARDAVIREAKEELGVAIEVGAQLGSASFTYDMKEWMYFWFEATIGDQVPSIGEPEKFDEVSSWHVEELAGRKDLSLNIINLLKSGVL